MAGIVTKTAFVVVAVATAAFVAAAVSMASIAAAEAVQAQMVAVATTAHVIYIKMGRKQRSCW